MHFKNILKLALTIFSLSIVFLGCASPRSGGSGKISKTMIEKVPQVINNDDIIALRRGFSYGTLRSADFTLITRAYTVVDTNAWMPNTKIISEEFVIDSITKTVSSGVDRAVCFSIQGTQPSQSGYLYFNIQSDFDPKSFEGFVTNSKGEFSWLDFGALKNYVCSHHKIDVTANLQVFLQFTKYDGKISYHKLEWLSDSTPNQTRGEPTSEIYKRLNSQHVKPDSTSVFVENSNRFKVLIASIKTNNLQAFKKNLPKAPLTLAQTIELSQLYASLGRTRSCSTNKFFKHIETYQLRADVVATQVELAKYDRNEYLACPEIARIAFNYASTPQYQNDIPTELVKSLNWITSKELSQVQYLQSILKFYTDVVNTYYKGCESGQQDHCVYVTKYRQDLLSLNKLIKQIRLNQSLSKMLDEIVKKRKIKSRNNQEIEII